METLIQIIIIFCLTVIALAALYTLDNIFGKNTKTIKTIKNK